MAPTAPPPARYRIVEPIGRGGMGEVCLADDLMLHRRVALKFLSSAGESDALDQLLSEARAAAALDHPFICSIYEVTDLNGRPCIAMEYVRGQTFERRLENDGPLGLAEGLRVAEEIAEAMDAAHKRRIIHRDLKPANVMLTEDQHVKVMDFGLATRLPIVEGQTDADRVSMVATDVVIRGTPAYMAPEQIRGEAADRRSDIFAFGILLYELLAGTNPFGRTGIDATLAAILNEPVANLHDRVSTIPTSVATVVAQMLAKNPAHRHQSFGDVRIDLRRLAVDLSSPASHGGFIVVDRAPSDARARLIGRDAERAQLHQSISDAASGHGTLVVLTGEAGIGKTRLAEEALNVARRLGCQTLIGRCYEQDGTPPLIPYIEVMEEASRLMPVSVFRQAIAPSASELAKLLPELHRLFPDLAEPLELPPQLRQRFLFTNVREFLARCARAIPLAIFIDDLQWADESTLQLTKLMAPHLATVPIVMIAGYREIEVAGSGSRRRSPSFFERVRGQTTAAVTPQEIKAALDDLAHQRQARAITLRPLTDTEVRDMLAALGPGDPPAHLVRKFADRTEGNPFFIEELFTHLKEEGRLLDAQNKWRRDLEFDDVNVPDSVRVVLERRIQHLSSETQKVLKAAAVIGRRFELELLEAIADVDEDTLLSALEEAEQARLLKGPSGRQEVSWRFAHQLVCQTLAGGIPQLRRQRLHLRVADAMAGIDGSSQVHLADIAQHLYSAGRLADPVRTVRALMTAGDAAHAVYATDDAVQHYRRALEVLEDAAPDNAMRLHVEERLADLLALRGDRAAAMEHYHTLSGVYQAAPTRIDLARIARKMGTLHWQGGDRAQATASYRRALDVLDGSTAYLETAHLYQELGLAAFRSGDNTASVDWAERALRSAETALSDASPVTPEVRKAAAAAIAHATNTIGVALARSGQLDAARERIERSVTAARDQGLLDVACRAYANLGVLYSTLEPKRAIDVSLIGLELAAKIGAASLQSYIYANLAAAYCALTDRCETEGLQAARAAASLDRELGQLDHLAVPLIVIGQIHQCRGELHQAQEAYREALALAETMGEPQLILPCYDGLATICLDHGDRNLAEQYMQKARDLSERTGLDPDTLLLLPFLC
jgi:adenylate cyclase